MNSPDPLVGQGGVFEKDPVTGQLKRVQAATVAPDNPAHPKNQKTEPPASDDAEGQE